VHIMSTANIHMYVYTSHSIGSVVLCLPVFTVENWEEWRETRKPDKCVCLRTHVHVHVCVCTHCVL
jgi:hypothetical protein